MLYTNVKNNNTMNLMEMDLNLKTKDGKKLLLYRRANDNIEIKKSNSYSGGNDKYEIHNK